MRSYSVVFLSYSYVEKKSYLQFPPHIPLLVLFSKALKINTLDHLVYNTSNRFMAPAYALAVSITPWLLTLCNRFEALTRKTPNEQHFLCYHSFMITIGLTPTALKPLLVWALAPIIRLTFLDYNKKIIILIYVRAYDVLHIVQDGQRCIMKLSKEEWKQIKRIIKTARNYLLASGLDSPEHDDDSTEAKAYRELEDALCAWDRS